MSRDFANGAVPRPSDQTVQQKLASLRRAYPESENHLKAFKRLGSQYIYADIKQDPELGRIGVALLRLSDALEQTFGFTRELLVLYTPHSDLQVRTFGGVSRLIERAPREVTPDMAFLSAPDPRVEQKLDDWSRADLTVLPLPALPDDAEEASERLLNIISQRVFARDLFLETTPVSGEKFFGRQRLLQSLEQDLMNGRSPGLFGMRKTGKTSVLRQLKKAAHNRDRAKTIFVIRDLESLPSPMQDPVPDLLADLTQDLLAALRDRDLRTYELVELDSRPTIPEFRRAFQTVIRKIGDPRLQFIFALDEVEYLCPPELTQESIREAQSIPRFLGALRSIQQESPGFTFILCGLSSEPLEASTLFGRTNPIFSWSKSYYLKPFTKKESDELVKAVGFRMGASWDGGSLDEILKQSGGHPYLLRSLASRVMESLPVDPRRRSVYRSHVEDAARTWRRDIAGTSEAMLEDVRRHYPDEMVLLDLLLEDQEGFRSLAAAEEGALGRVIKLGLVQPVTAEDFKPSRLFRALSGS